MPEGVREVAERIKKEYPFKVSIKRINGKYYIYHIYALKGKEDKAKKVTEYLGRITEEGQFVKKLGEKVTDNKLKLAEEIIRAYGGKVIMPHEPVPKELMPQQNNQQQLIDEKDKIILTALSMNARIKYSKIGAMTGLPVQTVAYRIKRLEKEFRIKYTEELDLNKLGFSNYLILGKFLGEKPSAEAIKKAAESEPRVQLAMTTKGKYDVVMFCVGESTDAISWAFTGLREKEGLGKYESEWYISPLRDVYNFVPLRSAFFDLLEKRVWHRTRGNSKAGKNDLKYREFVLLKELNKNSIESFSTIDAAYGLPKGSAKNAYESLRSEEREILIRPTIGIEDDMIKFDAILLLSVLNRDLFGTTRNLLRLHIINEKVDRITNKFTYIADMETPDGILFISSLLKEGDLEREEIEINDHIKGISFHSLIVSSILVGKFCKRRFDNSYSKQYLNLVKNKQVERKEALEY